MKTENIDKIIKILRKIKNKGSWRGLGFDMSDTYSDQYIGPQAVCIGGLIQKIRADKCKHSDKSVYVYIKKFFGIDGKPARDIAYHYPVESTLKPKDAIKMLENLKATGKVVW